MVERSQYFEQFRIRDVPEMSDCDLGYFRGEGDSNYPSNGEYLDPESSYRYRFTDLSNWIAEYLPEGTIADIGGSMGHLHYWMQRLHPDIRVITAEPGYDVLEYGKKNDESLRAVQSSGDSLPFRSNSLDGILFADVLEHMQPVEADAALSEASRVLPEGGHLFISVPNKHTWSDKNWKDPTHLWIPSARGMKDALTQNGFQNIDITTRGFPWSMETRINEDRDVHLPFCGTGLIIHAQNT